MATRSAARPYRKQVRAQREEATRRRITEAAVELHRTRGPAHTTVTDVAHRAGVSRMTVYSHFPTEGDLLRACSSHWTARHPFPDPAPWGSIDDPSRRLDCALGQLYRWYERHQDMLGNVFRDMPVMPSLDALMTTLWRPYADEVVQTLARGWPARGAGSTALRAALGLVVDFGTWRLLTAAGLSAAAAARQAARMVRGSLPA